MMKKKNIKEKEKPMISKINEFTYGYVFLQFTLTVVVLVFLVLYIIYGKFIKTLLFFMGLLLLVMGYNNTIIYFRKGYTKIYYISGIVVLILFVLLLVGII